MRKLLIFVLILTLNQFLFAAEKKAKTDPAAEINKPRPDARKISFETSEGTWMSIDVTREGTTILFDLLGDIYILPIAGGLAKAITSGPAYDSHPRYSPDGKTIAFSSDRGGMENLWLMDADGKNPRALTEEKDAYIRSAVWTPDGNYLIARKEDARRAGIPPVELWIYHKHGGSGIKLTSADEINNASGPVVSPDGRYIYFSSRRTPFSYIPNLSQGLWEIERYDRQTGQVVTLTGGFGGAVRPSISPDGKTIVYVSRRDDQTVLISRDLSTGRETILLRGVTRDEQEGFAQMDLWPNYAFMPDGKSIVFTNQGKIQKLDLSSLQTSDIPFTAEVQQSVSPRVAWQEKVETGPVKAKILRWPSQSPDGQWVVFDSFGRIWLQALGKTGVSPRRVTPQNTELPQREYSPSFSPDGKWVAYVTWNDQNGGHVWKAPISAEGEPGNPQQLTQVAGHYANPSWSRDGKRLLFIQGSGLEFRGRQPEEEQFFEVRWMPAEGGEAKFITTINIGESLKFHPQAFWSADGTRVFYRDPIPPAKPTDDPKNDLVSVRLDGSDKKNHLRFPAIGDVVPSPDEHWVVFTSRDNVYVAALPKVQLKEPPEVGLEQGSVPVWRLSDEAGGYVGWADGGKTITWSLGNRFHKLPLDSAIQFVEEQKKKKQAGGDKKETPEVEELRVPKSQQISIDISMPRAIPQGSFVLRGARVITMKEEEILENADVVVTDNRIAAVGSTGSVKIPAGAREIDAKGKTIIPGFIDTHAHLHYSGFEVFPETKWEYIANLAYGVTTTYDPSAPSLDVFAQAEMVEAGLMTGPRVYSSGDVLYGGQQTDIFAKVEDFDDAKRQVRRMKAYGARMIKVYQQPRRAQRLYFAEACRELHMLLTAEGAGEYNTDLTMVMDGFTAFEHSLPITIYKDAVQLIAKSDTYYSPTLLVSYGGPWGELFFWQTQNPHDDPKLNRFVPHLTLDPMARRRMWISPEEYHFPRVAESVAKVYEAGGNIALGAHGQLQGLGVHWELWAMAGEGLGKDRKALTPMKALRTATIEAADKIGFRPDLGSIEPGKLADMIVLVANPLEDIHNTNKIDMVVKNGELYHADTMKQLWPLEKELPRFFWMSE